MKRWIVAAMAVLALAGKGETPKPELPKFIDITKQAGITSRHSFGDHHLDNIVEGTGGGVCVFDYDGDGFMDLYFVSGTWTQNVSDNEGRDLRGKLSNHLYRNNGNGTFTDVTEKAGVGGNGVYSTGCSAADYDNDGHVDLYVLNYGRNILYHNNGDGTFTDRSKQSGLDDPRWSLSATWFDYNGDGLLDVFVANYLIYDDGKFRDFYPAAGYPGPLSYSPETCALYRNNGDGTFAEVTKEAGLVKPGRAMSATAADFRNVGLLDIFIANDASANYYFENTGHGTFVEKALEYSLAYGENGQGVSSMGPVVGDINRDGLLDLFIPNLNYCILWVQRMVNGNRDFVDRSAMSGISMAMGQYAGWGAVMIDYDNDGWLDLFTAHGDAHHEYVQENSLVRNKGNGNFEDVSDRSGPHFRQKHVARGAAGIDLDNDGQMDLVIANLNDVPILLRNDGGSKINHWLTVEAMLKFPTGTREANGARVTVTTGALKQVEDVIQTRGYLSQTDPRLHFGLGAAKTADSVEVRWPDGVVEKFANVKADQLLKLTHDAKVIGGKK